LPFFSSPPKSVFDRTWWIYIIILELLPPTSFKSRLKS